MVSVRRKRGVNALRIGIKVGTTVLGLYAGGFFLTELGNVMNGTCSPFYKGLSLIGWTVGSGSGDCAGNTNTITATSGSGILAVIGIVAIAMLVFEFIDIRM